MNAARMLRILGENNLKFHFFRTLTLTVCLDKKENKIKRL